MNMRGRNSHCQGLEVGRFGTFVSRKESPCGYGCGEGRGGDRQSVRGPVRLGADVLEKSTTWLTWFSKPFWLLSKV